MKKTAFIITAFLLTFTLLSFTKNNDNEGINFFTGNFQEALMKANDENKLVFLDIHASWCGPCKKLKKSTFKNEEVGTYFNNNYISIAIDGETKEGIELVKKYNIKGYPTLIIIDKNGKLLTQNVGFIKPQIMIDWGKKIVP
jgi:thioredoxin-related protein